MTMHRRMTTAVALLVALGAQVSATPAWADSVTVQGTSDLDELTDVKKMMVNNRQGSVLVKIHGTGGKDLVRWVAADLKDGDGTKYRATAAWHGAEWIVSLGRGPRLVNCDAMVFKYVADPGFWKVIVPRSCLGRLANRIKAKSEISSTVYASPGYTPWSPWVARG